MNRPTIGPASDGSVARHAAARISERIQAEVNRLHSNECHDAAEHLTHLMESADLGAATWGDCYLRLLAVLDGTR